MTKYFYGAAAIVFGCLYRVSKRSSDYFYVLRFNTKVKLMKLSGHSGPFAEAILEEKGVRIEVPYMSVDGTVVCSGVDYDSIL